MRTIAIATYLLFLVGLTVLPLEIEANTELWIKQFECYDHPYATTVLKECFIQTVRKAPSLLTLVLLVENSTPRVYIDYSVYSQYQHTRSYLFGTSFDYCEFQASAGSLTNPVARLAYDIAIRNFPQALLECPVLGTLNITKLAADMNLVPAVIPMGRFHVNCRIYNKRNQTMLAWRADFTLSQGSLFNRTLSMLG